MIKDVKQNRKGRDRVDERRAKNWEEEMEKQEDERELGYRNNLNVGEKETQAT